MPNIEDFETPEELLQAAVGKIRQANGVKIFELPMEATEAQRTTLSQELRARHPWHTIICIHYHGGTDNGEQVPPERETHTLDELRGMIDSW